MYPIIPFGPLSLPTGPILTVLAFWFGLDLMSRYAQRLDLNQDDVWNTGMISLLAALIVARLWNVVQFWSVYIDEPLLIISPRPSGLAFGPGIVTLLIVGYGYLIYKSIDPIRFAVALCVGGATGGILLNIGAFLTGAVVGLPSTLPWALPHFDELLHPVALYQAIGLGIWLLWLWLASDARRPVYTILLSGLFYSLLRLFVDGYRQNTTLLAGFRLSQLVALGMALLFCFFLAQHIRRESHEHQIPEEIPPLD